MDKQAIDGRLAAYAVEPEEDALDESSPAAAEPDAAAAEEDAAPATVAQVLRLYGTLDSAIVVAKLRQIGALEERSGKLIYKLSKPLCKPLSGGVDPFRGVEKITFQTELSAYHKRRMARQGEGPENAVLLTWVEALTNEDRGLIDRLHWTDAEAAITIAHSIESSAGNE